MMSLNLLQFKPMGVMLSTVFVVGFVVGILSACQTMQVADPIDPFGDKRGQMTPQSVLSKAEDVLKHASAQDDQFTAELNDAKAVLILPQLIRLGFGFAGQQGPGVLFEHAGGGTWRGPAFVWYRQASYGLQAGLQRTDMIMIVRDEITYAAIRDNRYTINVDMIATWGGQSFADHWTHLALNDGVRLAVRGGGFFAGLSGGVGQITMDDYWTGKYFGNWDMTVNRALAEQDRLFGVPE